MTTYQPPRSYIGCRPTWRVTVRRFLMWLDENSYDVFIAFWLLVILALVGGK